MNANAPAAGRARVWVVDDSPGEAQRTQQLLSRTYDVEVFFEGATMLEKVASAKPPDLVLLDWQMPGVSGVDTCRFLRERFDEVTLPILMLTVRGSRQDLTEALSAGANDYVAKPYDDAELLARVRTLVRTRQQAEAAHQLSTELRFVSEAVPAQMWTASPAGHFSWVNRQTLDYFAVPEEKLLGEGWMNFVHPDDVADVHERWVGSISAEQPLELHLRFLRGADRTYRWHLMRATPYRDTSSALTKWYGSQTDVHQMKEVQTQLEERNIELDRFAYMASHDLKAPLRAFANLVQFISDDLGTSAPPAVLQHLKLMDSRVGRMHRLVDALLDYARSVNGRRDDVAIVDLEAMVDDVVSLLDNPRGIKIELARPFPTVRCSPTGLRQVLQNLIANALKHGTTTGQPIVVRAATEPGGVLIEVIDHGAGIPPAQQQRIWELFQSISDDPTNSGIGLSIVRGTIQRMGGSVGLDSSEGKGSRFFVRLPSGRQPG